MRNYLQRKTYNNSFLILKHLLLHTNTTLKLQLRQMFNVIFNVNYQAILLKAKITKVFLQKQYYLNN